MNIHFKDITLFEKLNKSTLAKIRVGSHVYGNSTERSDNDYLYIYATSDNELNSFIIVNHQLQFKEDNIDHNFVSLHTFLRNAINGDSTINIESIFSNELKGTSLEWITKYKNSFVTYSNIRSYLGFARRDLKFISHGDDYTKRKRKGHIVRGYTYAKNMLSGNFDFDLSNKEFISYDLDLFDKNEWSVKIDSLRKELNEKLNNNELNLARNMDVKSSKLLNNELFEFINSDFYKKKKLVDFDIEMYLDSFENWVSY